MTTPAPQDHIRAFTIQYRALRLSASAFDSGDIWEAVRMANAIFTLCGIRMRRHKSLLSLIEPETSSKLLTSRGQDGLKRLVQVRLVVYENLDGNSAKFHLDLEPIGKSYVGDPIEIIEWWDEIIEKSNEVELSRINLIRVLRDRDGGAHFDEFINDENYKRAASDGCVYRIKLNEKEDIPAPFYLENLTRQVAEEVLMSLYPHYLRTRQKL